MINRAAAIKLGAETLFRSIENYEKAFKNSHRRPEAGYEVTRYDSKTNIQDRIRILRAELLELSHELDELKQ